MNAIINICEADARVSELQTLNTSHTHELVQPTQFASANGHISYTPCSWRASHRHSSLYITQNVATSLSLSGPPCTSAIQCLWRHFLLTLCQAIIFMVHMKMTFESLKVHWEIKERENLTLSSRDKSVSPKRPFFGSYTAHKQLSNVLMDDAEHCLNCCT